MKSCIKNVLINLIFFGHLVAQRLSEIAVPLLLGRKIDTSKQSVLSSQCAQVTLHQSRSQRCLLKTTVALILVVNLPQLLQCSASASGLNPECNPQTPNCKCNGTLFYHESSSNSCQECPFCRRGFQPNKNCGEDGNGEGVCVPCPDGTFSNTFDQAKCFPCKQCNNTVDDIPCISTSDRECGKCAPTFGLLNKNNKGECLPCDDLRAIADDQDSCNSQTMTTTEGKDQLSKDETSSKFGWKHKPKPVIPSPGSFPDLTFNFGEKTSSEETVKYLSKRVGVILLLLIIIHVVAGIVSCTFIQCMKYRPPLRRTMHEGHYAHGNRVACYSRNGGLTQDAEDAMPGNQTDSILNTVSVARYNVNTGGKSLNTNQGELDLMSNDILRKQNESNESYQRHLNEFQESVTHIPNQPCLQSSIPTIAGPVSPPITRCNSESKTCQHSSAKSCDSPDVNRSTMIQTGLAVCTNGQALVCDHGPSTRQPSTSTRTNVANASTSPMHSPEVRTTAPVFNGCTIYGPVVNASNAQSSSFVIGDKICYRNSTYSLNSLD